MSDVTSNDAHPYPRLLSLAVHEFRGSASVVGGYLRMLQSGVAGTLSDQQRKMVGEAEKSCAQIVRLIAELSDIGKLDTGAIPLNETPVDLFQLLTEVASDMHEADERGVQLQVRGDSAGATIVGDRSRLSGALSVFLRAILREQPTATTVIAERRLARHADRQLATIVVAREDSIHENRQAAPAPFDEFRGGLGLGLPLARRVIERYGGRVWTPALPQKERQGLMVSVPVEPSRQE